MNWTEEELRAYLSRRNVSTRSIAKISEKVFEIAVRDIALTHGWRYYHTFDSRRSAEGFLDCVLVHPKQHRLIFAELKSEDGKLRQSQQGWFDDLTSVILTWLEGKRPEIYVWYPSDLEQIWQILSPVQNLRQQAYSVEQTGDDCPQLIVK